jgi:hypothetical protein
VESGTSHSNPKISSFSGIALAVLCLDPAKSWGTLIFLCFSVMWGQVLSLAQYLFSFPRHSGIHMNYVVETTDTGSNTTIDSASIELQVISTGSRQGGICVDRCTLREQYQSHGRKVSCTLLMAYQRQTIVSWGILQWFAPLHSHSSGSMSGSRPAIHSFTGSFNHERTSLTLEERGTESYL